MMIRSIIDSSVAAIVLSEVKPEFNFNFSSSINLSWTVSLTEIQRLPVDLEQDTWILTIATTTL